MEQNMSLYNKFMNTPKEAQKTIKGGRLNGFTDINPMWRFKMLTEAFGPCGIGWKYEITDQRIVSGPDGKSAAFVDILLYYNGARASPVSVARPLWQKNPAAST